AIDQLLLRGQRTIARAVFFKLLVLGKIVLLQLFAALFRLVVFVPALFLLVIIGRSVRLAVRAARRGRNGLEQIPHPAGARSVAGAAPIGLGNFPAIKHVQQLLFAEGAIFAGLAAALEEIIR